MHISSHTCAFIAVIPAWIIIIIILQQHHTHRSVTFIIVLELNFKNSVALVDKKYFEIKTRKQRAYAYVSVGNVY